MSPWYVSRTGSTIAPCDERGWDRVEYHGTYPLAYCPPSLRSFVHWYNVAVLHAGVAELVDAPDSKSGGAKAPCRFEPDLRYSGNTCKQCIFRAGRRKPTERSP